MIRSETRGVARGAMPKRSRSARGPPVCIISMAQQASPNIMYQTDDLRVQLRKSSTLVVSAISGAVLMSDMLRLPSGRRAWRARLGRAEQDAEPQHQPTQHEGEREEDENVGELEVHRNPERLHPPARPCQRKGQKPFQPVG